MYFASNACFYESVPVCGRNKDRGFKRRNTDRQRKKERKKGEKDSEREEMHEIYRCRGKEIERNRAG